MAGRAWQIDPANGGDWIVRSVGDVAESELTIDGRTYAAAAALGATVVSDFLASRPTSFGMLLVQPSYRFDRTHTVLDDETAASPARHELTVRPYARLEIPPEKAEITLSWDPDRRGVYAALDFVALMPFANPNCFSWHELGAGERVGGAVLFVDRGDDRLNSLVWHAKVSTKTDPRGLGLDGVTPFSFRADHALRVLLLPPAAQSGR